MIYQPGRAAKFWKETTFYCDQQSWNFLKLSIVKNLQNAWNMSRYIALLFGCCTDVVPLARLEQKRWCSCCSSGCRCRGVCLGPLIIVSSVTGSRGWKQTTQTAAAALPGHCVIIPTLHHRSSLISTRWFFHFSSGSGLYCCPSALAKWFAKMYPSQFETGLISISHYSEWIKINLCSLWW